ncbi:MAG: hypothetical protein IPG18_13680 [Saprospiraceae bacterium]|nr:hypothetical protein [Saprospiraceae bacterium]MBK7525525.1 hypothetical protein [Saprospiraceae bacterium]MBK8855660.1 hypothetical protein [Saprospiraceae bacterium]
MHKITLFIFLSILIFQPVFAQKTIKEGVVKMEISDISSNDPQTASALEMMKGSIFEIYFTEKENLTLVNMMGGLMEMKIHVNDADNVMNMYMDMMGQKYLVESKANESITAEQKEAASKMKIEYDKNDTKEIAGYKCYKMKITSPDMQGMTVNAYITEEVRSNAKIIKGYEALSYAGFPLEYKIGNDAFSMTTTTKSIENKVDASKFKIDGTGYTKMTMEEFQKSFGGMGF